MIQRLPITTLMAGIQERVESTGKRCYDAVPLDAPAPFFFLELVSVAPKNTKSMYVDSFSVYIHCIAKENPSSVGVNALIQELQEAMTEDIYVPSPYRLLRAVSNGVTIIKTDETGERHAICAFSFEIAYGFICK